LNLRTFNGIFGFLLGINLWNQQVPRKFNPNAFLGELSRSVRYSTSSSKCTHIRNPCIRVAQHILTCFFFARDDSLNVSKLSLEGAQLDPDSLLGMQLYSAATSTTGRIVIGGIMTTIARFLGIESNPENRVSRSRRLDQAAFEIMNFCKVEVGRLC